MDDPAQYIQNVFIPVFTVLFLSVFVWFYLVSRLYNILSIEHPDIYKDLGEPTLFWNNSPRTALLLMKFIIKKKYLGHNSRKLEKHGNIMFMFFMFYTILFAFLFISFILVTAKAKP
jgi:hypothetical protein